MFGVVRDTVFNIFFGDVSGTVFDPVCDVVFRLNKKPDRKIFYDGSFDVQCVDFVEVDVFVW